MSGSFLHEADKSRVYQERLRFLSVFSTWYGARSRE